MEEINEIRVTDEFLTRLRKLADWQLREMGIDPVSVTLACQAYDDREHSDRLAGV